MTPQEAADSKIFLNGNPAQAYWDDVFRQAKRHTRRRVREVSDLIKTRRPNESEEIAQYRSANERQITRNGVNRFLTKISRLIRGGLVFSGIQPEVEEYLKSRPFNDNGRAYSLEDYLFNVILPTAFEHPNQIWLAVPYNEFNPEVAPNKPVVEGGLDPMEELSFYFFFGEPVYCDEDIAIIEGGTRRIIDDKGQEREEPYYLVAEESAWWVLEPRFVKIDTRRTDIVYDAEVWYRWDLSRSPINFLPGQNHRSEAGKYKESYLLPYYVYADEVINSFSDDQAVRTRFGYPHVGVEQTKCRADGCKSGYIGGKKDNPCQVCKGTGTVSWPGPYGVLVRDKQNLHSQGTPGNVPLMEFYHPDVNILEFSWKGWQELMKMAEQAIGLDLLDGTGVESGAAKDMRLEDLHDLLMDIAVGIGSFGLGVIRQIEALMVPRTADRTEVTYRLPASFKLKDPEQLREAAKNALQEDRFLKRLEYYQHEYNGQPNKVQGYRWAMMYAPALLLEREEIPTLLASGAITKDELIKRDKVMVAIAALSEREDIDFFELEDERVFELIDNYLIERGFIVPVTPMEQEERAGRSPLLDTVGGISGIINIATAVADGKMSEEAAENLLQEVYGLTPEVADRVIAAPRPQGISEGAPQPQPAPQTGEEGTA